MALPEAKSPQFFHMNQSAMQLSEALGDLIL
jgi:hypothetical protein